ncbi:hypothetical protein V8E52_004978 [Russula decolorans]|jgi:hypothetical protein
MSLPPPPNGLIAPHWGPCIQPPLPLQQPGLASLDVSQPNPRDTHLNNTHHHEPSNNVSPFPMTASNVPRSSVQNVNPSSQPSLVNGQISPWDIWQLLIPPPPDRSSHHSPTTQNTQAASACPTCPTHPTSGPVQFGGGRPAPAVQDLTAPTAAAPSSSSCPNSTAPHIAPPVPEAPLFRPGVADAGPTTANAYARKSKRARPRRAREVPFVRIEDRIEWVSRDVMKMTLFFNWSPDAETEAHEEWD